MNKQKSYAIIPIVLLLIMIIPPAMADTVTIDLKMDGDAYVNIQNDNGTFSIIYNGRDILGELEAAQKHISDMEKTFIYWAGQRANHDQDLLVIEEQLSNLTRDLNVVLGELYGNLGFTMHIVGVNPGNTTVSIQLIAGNMTIADYIEDILVEVDDILVELNATDLEFASIQLQFENIYAGMMMHDTLIMNGRSSVRQLNATFNAEISDLIERDESFDLKLTTEIERKDEQIQRLNEQIELLEIEFKEELARELKKTRESMNVISTMFGLFSVIAIGIVAKTRRQ